MPKRPIESGLKNDPGNLGDILGDQSADSDADVTKWTSFSVTGSDYVLGRKPIHLRRYTLYVPPPKLVLPSVHEVPSYNLPTLSEVTHKFSQKEYPSSKTAPLSFADNNSN